MNKTIRIGGASGFLGDSLDAAPQLLRNGNVDYLVFDYLAEVTMSLLAGMRQKDPEAGYSKDFVRSTMVPLAQDIKQQGVKILANAGGVNPSACATALKRALQEQGIDLCIAYIEGDDLLPAVRRWREFGLKEMFTGAPLPQNLVSMNAYLGAFPIAEALARGADIVVTGRIVDSALTLAACIHEFGWTTEDYDKLAMGSLAGHILECGAQACGALFTDWREVGDYGSIGYPIAECSSSGDFVVSKPEGTSGLVSRGTLAEQILYEVSDPQAYFLPDVVCDFSSVTLAEVEKDHVLVRGAKGYPPTDTYKVSCTYRDGWRTGIYVTIGGMEAGEKARATGEGALRRVERLLRDKNLGPFEDVNLEVLGQEDSYGPNAQTIRSREAVLKAAARHARPEALQTFIHEFTSLLTSGAPGTTGMVNYPPKITPTIRHFSTLVPKSEIHISLHMNAHSTEVAVPTKGGYDTHQTVRATGKDADDWSSASKSVPLVRLAWARSGDKGLLSNIGVIARKPEWLPYIRKALSPENVAAWMAHRMADGAHAKVQRFDVPGFHALNFVLPDALAGGGVSSLRNDPLGKAFAQMLLEIPVSVPDALELADG